MIPFTLTTSASTVEDSRISRVIAHLNNGWHRYLLRRRLKATIYTLQGLDSRTLSDIGLDRSEIESVVNSGGAGRRQRLEGIGFGVRHG